MRANRSPRRSQQCASRVSNRQSFRRWLKHPDGSNVSRVLLKNKGRTVTLFAFDRGEDFRAGTGSLNSQ